jgi:hypothetical protein
MTRGEKEFLRDIALATEAGHGRSMLGVMASTDSRKRWLRSFVNSGLVRLEVDRSITGQSIGAQVQRAFITEAGKEALAKGV